MIEELKQMVEVLIYIDEGANNQGAHTGISWRDVSNKVQPAIQAGKKAIKELESQEPVAYIRRNEYNEYRLEPTDNFKIEDIPVSVEVMLYTHPPQRTEQEPVAHLWECLGRWSAYLVDNGERADCSPPSWLVDAVKNATIPPAQPAKPIPCANHCEATAFEIVIKNLQGEIERLKASQRTETIQSLKTQEEEQLTQAQKIFEAMMRAKGYTDFSGTKGRYNIPALQTRWNYFLLGWEMRGVQ